MDMIAVSFELFFIYRKPTKCCSCYLCYSDPYEGIRGLNISQLSVLENVQEITDYLLIEADWEVFTDLKFLSNLRVIHGRNPHS